LVIRTITTINKMFDIHSNTILYCLYVAGEGYSRGDRLQKNQNIYKYTKKEKQPALLKYNQSLTHYFF
jgi:hypothetical protein